MARSVADLAIRLGMNAKPAFQTIEDVNNRLGTIGRGSATGKLSMFGARAGAMMGGAALLSGVASGGTAAIVGATISGITSAAEGALDAITGLAGGFFRTVRGAAEAGLEYDRQRTSLRQLTKSAEDADSIFDRMTTLSARGGGKLESLLGMSRAFIAAGQNAKLAGDNVEAVSTVSRIFNADVDRVSVALSQMLGKGVVMAEELRGQLLEAGIPLSFFSQQLGLTDQQFQTLQESGRMTGETLLWAFRNATAEGGRFAGALETAGQTASGTWDRFIGKLDLIRGKIGESLINRGLSVVNSLGLGGPDVDAITGKVDAWLGRAEGSARQVFLIVSDIWNLFGKLAGAGEKSLGTWADVEEKLKRARGHLPDMVDGFQKLVRLGAEFARWANIAGDRLHMIIDVLALANPLSASILNLTPKAGQSGIQLRHEWAKGVDTELREFLQDLRGQHWGAAMRESMAETDRSRIAAAEEAARKASNAAFGITGGGPATVPKPTGSWRDTLRQQLLSPRGDWEKLSAALAADRGPGGGNIVTGRGVLDAFASLSGKGGAGSAFGGDARNVEATNKLAEAYNRQASATPKVLDVLKAALAIQQKQDAREAEILTELRKIAENSPAAFAAPQGMQFKGGAGP